LPHDLGHPPSGHIAEEELDRLVKDQLGPAAEGYEGNTQSFRAVTALGVSDSAASAKEESVQPGLNLTKATLNAILKYPWLYGQNAAKKNKWGAYETEKTIFNWARGTHSSFNRSVEAEIMDWADDITYAIYDMIDFYCAGLIPLHLLASEQGDGGEWANFFDGACKRNKEIGRDRERYEKALRDALFFAA
jgi:dGTPase